MPSIYTTAAFQNQFQNGMRDFSDNYNRAYAQGEDRKQRAYEFDRGQNLDRERLAQHERESQLQQQNYLQARTDATQVQADNMSRLKAQDQDAHEYKLAAAGMDPGPQSRYRDLALHVARGGGEEPAWHPPETETRVESSDLPHSYTEPHNNWLQPRPVPHAPVKGWRPTGPLLPATDYQATTQIPGYEPYKTGYTVGGYHQGLHPVVPSERAYLRYNPATPPQPSMVPPLTDMAPFQPPPLVARSTRSYQVPSEAETKTMAPYKRAYEEKRAASAAKTGSVEARTELDRAKAGATATAGKRPVKVPITDPNTGITTQRLGVQDLATGEIEWADDDGAGAPDPIAESARAFRASRGQK